MNAKAQNQVRSSPPSSFTSAPTIIVQRKCACGGSSGLSGECAECQKEKLVGDSAPLIQSKLKVSQPNDKYEQEADRVADEVMRMPEPRAQRQVRPEKEEIASNASMIHEVAQSTGHSLDSATRNFMESRFGHNFGQVKIHTDNKAASLAQSMNARAYTLDQNIIFGAGQYAPQTINGHRLLAHELTHTIQQGGAYPALDIVQRRLSEPLKSLSSGIAAIRKGIGQAGSSVKAGVRTTVRAVKRASTPKESRKTLVRMVDQPDFAHKHWKKTSFGGHSAVLTGMRTKYGEDWVDEFVTRQESGLVNPRFVPLGPPFPDIEETKSLGFALAFTNPMAGGRFERWVHPDGSYTQMVRSIDEQQPDEEPLPAEDALPKTEQPDEEDVVTDFGQEEIADLMGFEVPGFEKAELISEDEKGNRVIEIVGNGIYKQVTCGPDDTCTGAKPEDFGKRSASGTVIIEVPEEDENGAVGE